MDRAAELAGGELGVDQLVLLDAAEAGEGLGPDVRAEVHVVGTLDLGSGAGNAGLDPLAALVRCGHGLQISHPADPAILPEVMSTEITYTAQGITITDHGAEKVH